jgi:LacI family transcriptional regulator
VLSLAARANYQPNRIAQSLQTRRSNTIGVIVPEIKHDFFASIISGIEEVSYQAGHTIMVCQSNDTYDREVVNTRALAANRVAGMLVSTSQETTDYSHLETVMAQGIPLVLFDRVVEELAVSMVIVDDFDGAYNAVTYLIQRGYRRIAHLSGSDALYVSRKRREGYEKALRDHGLPIDQALIVKGGYHEKDGHRGAQKLFASAAPPDAIFTINDPVAIGAYLYIRDAGLRIPEDVALVGFTNNSISAIIDPPMTTVNQPAFDIGKTAAGLLLACFETGVEKHIPRTEVLKTKLIVRKSA